MCVCTPYIVIYVRPQTTAEEKLFATWCSREVGQTVVCCLNEVQCVYCDGTVGTIVSVKFDRSWLVCNM